MSRPLPWVVFVVLGAAGTAASLAIAVARGGAMLNVAVELAGAFVAAYGVHALLDPASVQLARNAGTDSFGRQQFGASRQATAAQARRVGQICVAVGVALVGFGLFVGLLV